MIFGGMTMKYYIPIVAFILAVISMPCLADRHHDARLDLSAYNKDNMGEGIEKFLADMSEEQATELKSAILCITVAVENGDEVIAILNGKTPSEIIRYSERPEIQEAFNKRLSLLIQEAMDACAERQRVIEKWAPFIGFILLPNFTALALLIAVKMTGNDASFLALVLISYIAKVFSFIPWFGWLISGIVLWILLCRFSTAEMKQGFFIVVLAWLISMLIGVGLLAF